MIDKDRHQMSQVFIFLWGFCLFRLQYYFIRYTTSNLIFILDFKFFIQMLVHKSHFYMNSTTLFILLAYGKKQVEIMNEIRKTECNI